MRFLKVVLAMAALGSCGMGWTQVITVQSAGQSDALVAAQVVGIPSGLFVLTDQAGQAEISTLIGSDSILISHMGYRDQTVAWGDLIRANGKVYLEEQSLFLPSIPVTATRWSQSQRQSAQPLTVIRPAEVRLQNPQTAADVLGLSGQVFIQKSQQGGGSPMIRGFAANRVVISVDGVRMNTAIFRSGNLQNVIALDPLVLEQTEVIHGPGSLHYGSDAIGGVMLFQTRQADLIAPGNRLFKGQAFVRYGSAGEEMTGHLDLHFGRGHWAFLSSATYSTFGDLRMGRHGPDEYLRPGYTQRINGKDTVITNPNPNIQVGSGYDQINLMQKIRFAPNERWDLQYGFHYTTTSDVPRYDRLLRPRGNTLRSAEWSYGPQDWQMHHLQAAYKSESPLCDQLKMALAWQASAESRKDRDLNKPTRFVREEAVDAYSLNIDLLKALGVGQHLSYGLEGVSNVVASSGRDENVETGTAVAGPSRYPDGSTWSSWAAFALYHFEPAEKWSFSGGLRYNFVTLDASFDPTFYAFPFKKATQRNGAFTGNIGLIWRPEASWQFSFQGSSGFRSPNVDDVGKVFDSTPGFVVVPNPAIRPEYAWSGDLGITKTIGERVRVDLHVWTTLLEDALVRRDFTFDGLDSLVYNGELSKVQALQNAAQARVWGIQGSVEAVLWAGFRLSLRSSWQRGEEELDDGSTAPLRHAAPWFGLAQLQYEWKNWQANLSWQAHAGVPAGNLPPEEQGKDYLYAKDENGQPYVPTWSILNLKLLFHPVETVAISAGVENILDVRYRPYSSGISGPGRNVILGLRVGF